jgi:hypothetical protein
MDNELMILLALYAIGALAAIVEGVREGVVKRNPFGVVRRYYFLGIFVWGDAPVLGIFWLGATALSIVLRDSTLFLLFVSIFWTVRSLGEVQYWMHEQFSAKERNKPADLWGAKWFAGDSIWFVYQIFWQCMTVVFAVWTIYLVKSLGI